MTNEPKMRTHIIERTSPLGGPFIGECTLCGKPGLTIADANDACLNPHGTSVEDAVLKAIDGPPAATDSAEEQLTRAVMRAVAEFAATDNAWDEWSGNSAVTFGGSHEGIVHSGLSYTVHVLPAGELERLRAEVSRLNQRVIEIGAMCCRDYGMCSHVGGKGGTDRELFKECDRQAALIAEIEGIVTTNDDPTVQHCGCCAAIETAISRFKERK